LPRLPTRITLFTPLAIANASLNFKLQASYP
jgi:hypothetical protein